MFKYVLTKYVEKLLKGGIKMKYIGYDICPDCEGTGGVSSDTADLNCPSCLGEGYVAFNKEGYVPYNRHTKKIIIVKTTLKKVELKKRSYIEEGVE